MILFDATHTSHSPARTGIQRVCRSLFAELSATAEVTPVCFDPHLRGWRELDAGEQNRLAAAHGPGGGSRGARWTLRHRLAGHARRMTGRVPRLPAAGGLICPELFSALVGARLPELLPSINGPRIAIFHDAIGLKYPELTPAGTVARLPGYLAELRQFDGVAAVSEDSATALRDFWRWQDLGPVPPVQAIPLGVDPRPEISGAVPTGRGPCILSVGTLEGRKNHLALLDAAELLWSEGLAFELELIGLARPDTAARALARLRGLQAAGRPLHYHGSIADAALHAAYQRCTFTVYPSLLEGFGLPVLESLRHGRPCVCSAGGALGESARGGGCLTVPAPTAPELAAAMRRLLASPSGLADLTTAARGRQLRTWRDYTRDLRAWMQTLPSRP